ncbi:hypothetical protein NQ176_g3219 [Zarea fungicola]|uniref:Uncharacterized protein n=1 Tax=Zarea fungicola TaxID=93591 RepID=A0ACC1NKA7_9HYPO|nr:hypothetical protein NQ176_g3219 [Lecanicillium fungicola]
MSAQNNGSKMDLPLEKPGSVARARILAHKQQELAVHESEQSGSYSAKGTASPASSRNLNQKAIPQYGGGPGKLISRPSPMPQFPIPKLPSPIENTARAGSYRPPADRPAQAPRRPRRPSRIPSMVDQTRLQEPTPLFIAAPVRTIGSSQDSTDSQFSTSLPRDSGQAPSNTGYISKLPISSTMGQISEGPSSFYSNASLVSPIIEESPQSRSHGSYASSAAMPENWNAEDTPTRNTDTFYEESMTDVSPESEYGDEVQLVRQDFDSHATAPVGATHPEAADAAWPQDSSSDERRTSQNTASIHGQAIADHSLVTHSGDQIKDEFLHAYSAPRSSILTESGTLHDPSANCYQNAAIKRGLRIDMDAVREGEARGSLTSLPDLIRRATRLAAMIDKGKRPTSRMDNLNDFLGEKQMNIEGRYGAQGKPSSTHPNLRASQLTSFYLGARPHSGLSDMLAAFPPPVSTPQLNNGANRSSWLGQGGWPLVSGLRDAVGQQENASKRKRCCCGLPLWTIIVVTICLLFAVVAAIVVPLELLVFSRNGSSKDLAGVDKCQKDLICQNGGTNVVSGGICSCICSGGFTGSDCGTAGSIGCTTTDLVSADKSSSIKNVTLGQSIPRLIAEANSNFSIPLSGTSILAKINASGLSCIAQNSLVTFNGRSSRVATEKSTISKARRAPREPATHLVAQVENDAFGSHDMFRNPQLASPETQAKAFHGRTSEGDSFSATDDVFDFCRVAVLFILQEQGVDTAENAQTDAQAFFSKLTAADSGIGPKISRADAANITIGQGSSINLLKLNLDLGNGKGLIGGTTPNVS